MASDRDLVAEAGDGRGEDLAPSGPALREPGERDEDDRAHEEHDPGQGRHRKKKSPLHLGVPEAANLTLTLQVTDRQADRGQRHIRHERDGEQESRPVGGRREKERERQRVQTDIIGRVEGTQRLGAHQQEQEVDHGNDHVVADQEDVVERADDQDEGDRKPDLLQLQRQTGVGLPDQGDEQRESGQDRGQRLEPGPSREGEQRRHSHGDGESSVK